MNTDLNVTIRTEMGQKSIVRNLRNDGFVPAVCYGALKEATPIYVSAKELRTALSTEAKEHVLLNIKTDAKSDLNGTVAIIKDLTRHPIKRSYVHADLLVLDITKPIKVTVDVKLVGTAKGIKEGGILDQVRRVVDIKCLPTAIPSHIEIDITDLGLNENLHVSDMPETEGVEILTSGKLTIANLSEPARIVEAVEEGEEGIEGEEGEAAAEGAEETDSEK